MVTGRPAQRGGPGEHLRLPSGPGHRHDRHLISQAGRVLGGTHQRLVRVEQAGALSSPHSARLACLRLQTMGLDLGRRPQTAEITHVFVAADLRRP